MQPIVVLSYFDRKIGPTIFSNYPERGFKESEALIVKKLMDQIISEGFFTYSFNSSYLVNYYFEIDSEWARGKKEFLMLSVLFREPTSIEIEKTIFTLSIEFTEWLKKTPDIFTAFYLRSSMVEQEQMSIKNNSNLVKSWIKEFYEAVIDETHKKIEKSNITSLLENKDVMKTLELLSKSPISIKDLEKWYIKTFPHNNFHRRISTLFKYHLINIPKIGGRKKAPFNVHISDEVKTIANLVKLKNNLIKKFIQSNFSKAMQDLEKSTKQLQNFLKKVFSEKQIA